MPTVDPLVPSTANPAGTNVPPQINPGVVLPPGTVIPATVAGQQVLLQPIAQPPVQQPAVPAATVAPEQPAVTEHPAGEQHHDPSLPKELFLISHSNLFYWWPIWVVGYIMALITWLGGDHIRINATTEVWMHPDKNLGVIFTIIFFLVILITNVSVRGMASVVVILGGIVVVLTLAYFGWWNAVLNAFGALAIYMNLGFYVFFSTVVFLVWGFSFFIYDRLSFYRIRPGQVTHENIIGNLERSHDTRGMLFEKHQSDLFRHWILGFGSGDLEITTTGAKSETFYIPNVLFINAKLDIIQRMIAAKPTNEKAAG
jgi:hypothetical protein